MSYAVSRRTVLGLLGAGTLALVSGCGGSSDTSSPDGPALLAFTVFKDPSCGCCGGWAKHAEQNGFSIAVEHPEVLGDVFIEHDIAVNLQSCHLALNPAGTVFVGHVPARFILAYLKNPPAGTRGLTVPGMPVGTPGMETGEQFDPYEVLAIKADGSTEVFATVTKASEQKA